MQVSVIHSLISDIAKNSRLITQQIKVKLG